MRLNGARIVIEQLIAHGVDTVFGYPGGSVLTLYDELYKASDKIRHVLTAHEQGAAHAADGYARATGKVGVVIATSGPGATNLVTGIANAYLDSVPLIAITGNVSVPLLGRDSFQEVDIMGITQPIVKHNYVVRDVSTLEETLNEAFAIAGSGRRGPVLVDIPKNIQSDECDYHSTPPLRKTRKPCSFDVAGVAAAIKSAKKPYIYAGGGVIASGAEPELRALSEKLNAPVGLSMMGLTALPFDYPLNLGMTGMHGKYAATIAKSECDVLIALGVRFSDRATGNVGIYREGKHIIHVDVDLAEIGKNVESNLDIHGDVKDVLTRLLPELPDMRCDAWLERVDELKAEVHEEFDAAAFSPKNIIEAVRRRTDDDSVVVTDVGQHQMWVTQFYGFRKPRTLLTSGGLGAMGFGMGGAIGACMAHGKRRTVLFTGDGSFGMNLTELATAVSQELPLTIVVLNNRVLGLPRQWQYQFYEKRYSHTKTAGKTDFAAVGRAFGAEGFTCASLADVEHALSNLPPDKPAVLDCRIDSDERVMPMIPPGGSVKDIIVR